jgi:hypothetical protein
MALTVPRLFLIALLAATMCAACGNDSTTTSPSTTAGPLRGSELFGGRLGVGDSQFYSFTVGASGTTDVTLVSLRPAGVLTSTLSTVVGLGLGTPSGTGCALRAAVTTAPGLTKQVSVATDPSTYCVKVADVGNLTAAEDYTIRILHP